MGRDERKPRGISNLSRVIDHGNRTNSIELGVDSLDRDLLVKDLVFLLKYYEDNFHSLNSCNQEKLQYNFCFLIFRIFERQNQNFNKYDIVLTTVLTFMNYQSGIIGERPRDDGLGFLMISLGVSKKLVMLTDKDYPGDCFEPNFLVIDLGQKERFETIWSEIKEIQLNLPTQT